MERHPEEKNAEAVNIISERERDTMNTHENNQNDTNDQHERREEEDNNSEEKTASNTTETRSIFTGSNHTYSDHSSSDEDEDFASVGDECAARNTSAENNKEYDGEESDYYEPRDSLSQFSGSDRHLAEVLDRQLSAMGQSCADENSLDPEDLKAPSVQTDPTNPNNDILNSDMDESVSGGGTPRGIEAELRDPTKFTLKNLDTGAEYLVGEEAANALLHKKKKEKSRY